MSSVRHDNKVRTYTYARAQRSGAYYNNVGDLHNHSSCFDLALSFVWTGSNVIDYRQYLF